MKTNKSAARAAELLLLLSERNAPMTLLEIEQAMSMPKSSTFELVHTLEETGFLEQMDKKYSIGLNAFLVGTSYAERLDLIQISRDILEELSRDCKETIFLGKYMADQIVYVGKYASYANMASTCRIGSTKGLYYTGLGKAVLSALGEEELAGYFRRTELMPQGTNTITSVEKMREELFLIRRRGYAVEYCEGPGDAFCVASVIRDHNNQAIAAVSITASCFQMCEENKVRFGGLIQTAALEISRRLGFRGERLYG